MPSSPPPKTSQDFRSPLAYCGALRRSNVEVTGKDRASLLHGLCTNDIKRLQPGQGCEAFLTNVQGHVIGYVYVFCRQESLVLNSAPGEAETIIRSLDRYVVREDVQFHDRSALWQELLVAGLAGGTALTQLLGIPALDRPFMHDEVLRGGAWVHVRRTPLVGDPSWQMVTTDEALPALRVALEKAGCQACDDAQIEAARIEAGSPIYGRDITEDNLPQEIDRNSQAISFTKGCYLGQETVARIDALGHVNRLLRGLTFQGPEVPPAGADVHLDGKPIARITSACWSTRLDAPLALAYVRRGRHEVGTRFETPWGLATVVQLPVRRE